VKARRFNPFGAGIRNCLGQQLARMNVPTAVAMFVSNFHLALTPEVCRMPPYTNSQMQLYDL
jgi:cytochrome P450